MPRHHLIFAFLVAMSGISCLNGAGPCSDEVVPALSVSIADFSTRLPLSNEALAIVSDGAYVDTLRPCRFDASGRETGKCGADERVGTYTLRITVPGYPEWERFGIEVGAGRCHVETAVIDAEMVLPPNNPPTISAIRDTSVAYGDTLRLTARAGDADGDSLRYSLRAFFNQDDRYPDEFPSATLDSATGEFTYLPTQLDFPRRYFLVTVDDQHRGRDSTRFVVEILER